jgi:hypothetical protein
VELALDLLFDFDTADGDGNNTLTFVEAQIVLPGLTLDAFNSLDTNSSGGVSLNELIVLTVPGPQHHADQDGNSQFNLTELLRVVQFFNSDGFHCQAGTEDGYAPGPGDRESCLRHAADTLFDWDISLSEILRLVQFFNSGGYNFCPAGGTEDGYCVGLGG